MKKLIAMLVLWVFATVGLVAQPASAYSTPVGGQFCAKAQHDHYAQDADGNWLKCSMVGQVWKWVPSQPPLSPSPSVSPSTSHEVPTPTTSTSHGPTLPITGPNTGYYAGGGAALFVAGVVVFVVARRRRIKFEA